MLAAAGGKPGGTGGGGTGGVTPANAIEVRSLSEAVPAGGTVQAKFLLTQPRPITSTGASFLLGGMSVAGVAISNPLGDCAGAAVVNNGALYIAVISPQSDFGTNLDYPFLTITMRIPSTIAAGTSMPLSFPDFTAQSPAGPLLFSAPKPGTLTFSGSVSVDGVFPGGGVQPAGAVISVRGTGFNTGTRIATKMRISNPVYISPNEMRFTLQQAATMDQQPIHVTNPDGSQVTFYSYLRGTLSQPPSRVILQHTDPIFQTLTHGVATVGPLPAATAGRFTAVAVQNPTAGPVVVTFQLQRTGAVSTVMLPAGGRVMDDVAALLGGIAVAAGDEINITATSGVQILGLYADENAGTVTPFLPAF